MARVLGAASDVLLCHDTYLVKIAWYINSRMFLIFPKLRTVGLKVISHGFHGHHTERTIIGLIGAPLIIKCKKMHFVCFFMRDGFSHHLFLITTIVSTESNGIQRRVVGNVHLTWKTIQSAYHIHDTCIWGPG